MGARSGNNYLSSLKKLGAEIWIDGARAGDVTGIPRLRIVRVRSRRSTTLQMEHPEDDDLPH